MASFQAKIGWIWQIKRENKNCRSILFLSDLKQKTPKQIAKKFKKLKNTIIASFQAKVSWKSPRKGEKKNFRFYPTRNRKFQKNSKKIQKIKKYHYGFILSQNRLEKAEKDEK